MQPLRCEIIQPTVFLRQVVTDFLNSELAEGYPVEFELSMQNFPNLKADAFLLRRAINNLLINCVRHNAPGCPIRVGGNIKGAWCILFVESGDPPENIDEMDNITLAPDGGAAHGTGLKLVEQIASAHGGSAHFFTSRQFRCELYLPF